MMLKRRDFLSVLAVSLGKVSLRPSPENSWGPWRQGNAGGFESGQVSRAERKLGPFETGDGLFTVVIRLQKIEGAPDGFEETVESFSIVDARGVEHYDRSFEVEVGDGMFAETVGVSAWTLETSGKEPAPGAAAGLIIYYGYLPSAPSSGLSCQVFRPVKGRLTPSSPPLTVYGKIHDLEPGSRPEARRLGDDGTMEFGVWTGWFEVIVKVRVLDGLRTVPLHHQLTYGLDAFPVAVERAPRDEATFVRLFRSPGDTVPAHMVVRKDSAVEFLWVYAKVAMDTGAKETVIDVGERPWLKVRIDGREGFVKDEEDLMALGLQPAG